MPYQYIVHSGLDGLDKTRPNPEKDPVADLADAVSQIKRFLKDKQAGLVPIMSEAVSGQSYLKMSPVSSLPIREGVADYSTVFVTEGPNAGVVWIALPGQPSWLPLFVASYKGTTGNYYISRGKAIPLFSGIGDSIYEYNLAYSTFPIGSPFGYPVREWNVVPINNLPTVETIGVGLQGNTIVVPPGKYEITGQTILSQTVGYARARLSVSKYSWNTETELWDFLFNRYELESISDEILFNGNHLIPIKGVIDVGNPDDDPLEIQYRLVFEAYTEGRGTSSAGIASGINTGLIPSNEKYSHLVFKRYVDLG